MDVMIQAAFLVLVILVVRKMFGAKLHAYVRYGLWLVVALRLFIPVNLIDSPFSILHIADVVSKETPAVLENGAVEGGIMADGSSVPSITGKLLSHDSGAAGGQLADANGSVGASDGDPADYRVIESPLEEELQSDHRVFLEEIIGRAVRVIWLTGVCLVGGVMGTAHYRFRRRLYRGRVLLEVGLPDLPPALWHDVKKHRIPVYRVDKLESPCLAGVFFPTIYIGADIPVDSAEFQYIIMHETMHYLHKDHIWALARAVLVSLYWFHPFVWIAASASARDGEIACDYGTVRRLGQEERFAYGEMLLRLSRGDGGKRSYSYGTMLRSGKPELRERILWLAEREGGKLSAGVAAGILMLIVAGCTFTGRTAGGEESAAGPQDPYTAPKEAEVDADGSLEESEVDETPAETLQIAVKPAEVSGETAFGADGPCLDYAGSMEQTGESIIIFHDYFGLVVYSLTGGQVVRSLDLAAIGCDKTQGDDTCQVEVSKDGQTVWLHPMSKRYMYRYEVAQDELYQEPLVKTFVIDLEGEALFDRYLVSEDITQKYVGWRSNYLYEEYEDETGVWNAYIYLYVPEGETQVLRNLCCTWDDMVFMTAWGDMGDWGESEGDAEGFPYRYEGGVHDIEIIYDKPCEYLRIADVFESRIHPVTGEKQLHAGIDYAAQEGTDIKAAADGTVYETGYSETYGNYVVLLHENGDLTYYCQCLKVIVVKDQQVERGEKIAAVGSTGRSTGPHLHFALSQNGEFVDPEEHMRGVGEVDSAD